MTRVKIVKYTLGIEPFMYLISCEHDSLPVGIPLGPVCNLPVGLGQSQYCHDVVGDFPRLFGGLTSLNTITNCLRNLDSRYDFLVSHREQHTDAMCTTLGQHWTNAVIIMTVSMIHKTKLY